MKTFLASVLLVMCLGCGSCLPADPDGPRPGSSSGGRSSCSGPVGWSAVGTGQIHPSRLVSYARLLFTKDVAFSHQTGEATVECPGLYSISFAAYGSTPDTRVTLRRKTGKDNWADVVTAGGTHSGGGSNRVLLNLERGDQLAVWQVAGNVGTPNDRTSPATSFSGFRITK